VKSGAARAKGRREGSLPAARWQGAARELRVARSVPAVRFFRQTRLQRLVAGLVLAALSATLAPATAARSAREARLDGLLGHKEAVRAALVAADAAATPEAAVGAFVEAYRAVAGTDVPADAVASAVADLLLGRSFRPVPPPETRASAAPLSVLASPASPSAAVLAGGVAPPASAPTPASSADARTPTTVGARALPPARAP